MNIEEYPAPFGNKDNEINVARTICAEPDATLREWPILRNGKLFQANKGPGPDRILFGIIRHKNSPPISAVCGLITHTGAPTKNGFVRCDGWD